MNSFEQEHIAHLVRIFGAHFWSGGFVETLNAGRNSMALGSA